MLPYNSHPLLDAATVLVGYVNRGVDRPTPEQ
jgi:hypothetical protein